MSESKPGKDILQALKQQVESKRQDAAVEEALGNQSNARNLKFQADQWASVYNRSGDDTI